MTRFAPVRCARRVAGMDGPQRRALLKAAGLVPLVRLMLWKPGFAVTAQRLAQRSDGIARSHDRDRAAHTVEAVAMVAGRTLRGPRCLTRSLVAWYLLRRRGVDAVLQIGAPAAKAAQFEAHAWVELDGEVLWEEADVQQRFAAFDLPLPRLAPPR